MKVPTFYGNENDTFVVTGNGLIFLIASVDELIDAERMDELPKDVEEINYPYDIEVPDWIWDEA